MSAQFVAFAGHLAACVCAGQLAHGLAFPQFLGVMLALAVSFLCGQLSART